MRRCRSVRKGNPYGISVTSIQSSYVPFRRDIWFRSTLSHKTSYARLSLFLTDLEPCDILYWMDFSFGNEISSLVPYLTRRMLDQTTISSFRLLANGEFARIQYECMYFQNVCFISYYVASCFVYYFIREVSVVMAWWK